MNSIVNLKTLSVPSPNGPVPAIIMGLNIEDLPTADDFIAEVAEKFKLQRMCSPPNTGALLITIVTTMPVKHFVDKWRRLATADKILGFFMSQMQRADALRGTTAGETLETASLLDTAV